MVKVSVFLKAVGSTTKLEAEDADLFSEYAEKLAEQGLLVTAAKYSSIIYSTLQMSVRLLRTLEYGTRYILYGAQYRCTVDTRYLASTSI